MQGKAFFISPDGKLIEIDSSHIRNILDNPEVFGYSKDELIDIYKKYNEKIGLEGKAREEILMNLVQKGWIRIRQYYKPDFWSLQVNRLSKSVEEKLYKFANMIKDNKLPTITTSFDTLKITSLFSKKVFEYSAADIIKGNLFDMAESKDKSKYLEIVKLQDYKQHLLKVTMKEYSESLSKQPKPEQKSNQPGKFK